jgi:hypothetical protein
MGYHLVSSFDSSPPSQVPPDLSGAKQGYDPVDVSTSTSSVLTYPAMVYTPDAVWGRLTGSAKTT